MSRAVRRTGTNGVIGPSLEQLPPRVTRLRRSRAARWLLGGGALLLLLLWLGYC